MCPSSGCATHAIVFCLGLCYHAGCKNDNPLPHLMLKNLFSVFDKESFLFTQSLATGCCSENHTGWKRREKVQGKDCLVVFALTGE